MQEEAIDFGNLSRKILVNPIVPLQLINIKCRNNTRVQATILGKIYSNAIEILEIVPVGLCEENKVSCIIWRSKPSTSLSTNAASIT